MRSDFSLGHEDSSGRLRGIIVEVSEVMLRIVITAIVVGLGTITFIYILVYLYYIFVPSGQRSDQIAVAIAAGWLPAAFFFLAVFAGAAIAGFSADVRGAWVGLIVGTGAMFVLQGAIYLKYPPVIPAEVALYTVLGVCGGVLGGWYGNRELGRSRINEELLLRAIQAVANSNSADAVADAIGSCLEETSVRGVALWRIRPELDKPEVATPDGLWTPWGKDPVDVRELLAAFERRMVQEGQEQLLYKSWPRVGEKRSGNERSVRAVYVGSLVTLNARSFGLILIALGKKSRLGRRVRNRISSAAAAAMIALGELESSRIQLEQEKIIGAMQERERLAGELHDSILGYLAGVHAELNGASMALEVGMVEQAPGHVSRAIEGMDLAVTEVRGAIRGHGAAELDGRSLDEALELLIRRFEKESGILVSSDIQREVTLVGSQTSHAVFRVAQEALTNARVHSGANQVRVKLRGMEGGIRLEIADDGRGQPAEDGGKDRPPNRQGFGTRFMVERAHSIGGRLLIEGGQEGGTKVILETRRGNEGA